MSYTTQQSGVNRMKQVVFFVLLCALSSLGASPNRPIIIPPSSLVSTDITHAGEDEVAVVTRLIQTTAEQLTTEQHLKELMISFKQERESFAAGDYSKKRASQMVRYARDILQIITDLHVQHLFPNEYLEEIKVFTSIASKNHIKKPS